MKKILDKLFNKVRFDKKYIVFCMILSFIAIVTGSLFIVILNNSDKNLVIEYIDEFINSIKNNNFNYIDTFKNTIILNYFVVFIISILGFTYFLTPINIIILFYKAFVLGFSLSSFILTYKFKGLVMSIAYIFPHLILNLLLYIILTSFTLKLSFNMIRHIFKKRDISMIDYSSRYLYTTLFVLFLITLSSLYESFVAPALLRLIVNVF